MEAKKGHLGEAVGRGVDDVAQELARREVCLVLLAAAQDRHGAMVVSDA